MNKRHPFKILNTNIDFYFDGAIYNIFYLDLIKNSKLSIVLHTYIFKLDEIGIEVYQELLEATKRGVSITILLISSLDNRHFID